MNQPKKSENLPSLAIFLLLLACFTYFFPRWADPNQNSRLDMVFAVVEHGTFAIDPYVWNTVDYAQVGDHFYSDKAPGTAFLGIPLYAALDKILDLPVLDPLMQKLGNNQAFQATLREGGSGIFEEKIRFAIAQVFLSFMLSALVSALLGVLLFRLAYRLVPAFWPRLLMVLGYALLTPAFAYSGALYGHQLAAFLLFAVFALVFGRSAPLSAGRLALSGLLLGLSVVTEYPAALIAGILFVYIAYILMRERNLPRLAYAIFPGLVVAAGWMAYNNAVFGSPFKLSYSASTLWTEQHETGFMSLTAPTWEATWGITFGLFRGLFVLSPFLLLALPGFALWWRSRQHRAEFWVALTSTLAFFLFNASSVMWWGGFSIGPRYLLPALPFMALAIVYPLAAWGRSLLFRLLLFLLVAWSLVATWGLTLAGQAFPSDAIRNPLVEYALPNWQAGNLARNVGTILGLPGVFSLLPLLVIVVAIAAAWWLLDRRKARRYATPVEARGEV